MLKVKTNMPEDNQQPNPKSSPTDDSANGGQIIQPTSINANPASPQPLPTPAMQTAPLPTGVVNGQPFSQQTPVSSGQIEQLYDQKPSKWRYFFIVLGTLQAAGIALFFLVMFWASQQAKAGVSGTEFIALILFVTVVPAVAIISLVNLIGLPIYMRKHKPHGKGLIFCILSLVISGLLVLYGAYNVYGLTVYPKKLSEESRQKSEHSQQEFAAANAKPEITKEEAIQLLMTCKLIGFYYTNQTDKSDPANGGWGELSSTGVVLTKVDGQLSRISIADKLIPELLPIAREAQKTCANLQFWHDGTYEQYKDGKWYFKGVVVNSTQSGKTKDEAINFMQNCKADYFVGYTDINLVKDANTKSWLNKAEQSSTGIEISEGSPSSYVFASKSMTTALQDTARQFRQSCYNTKKLYITIDDWIETEYPQGKWTRVKQ
ncbi:MAG: hypothetical protein JWP13_823 [Candidatus Saccharibacteria bacterium]|nr:hypothetical protein [Candidatus Saccharibacteria bacterium]